MCRKRWGSPSFTPCLCRSPGCSWAATPGPFLSMNLRPFSAACHCVGSRVLQQEVGALLPWAPREEPCPQLAGVPPRSTRDLLGGYLGSSAVHLMDGRKKAVLNKSWVFRDWWQWSISTNSCRVSVGFVIYTVPEPHTGVVFGGRTEPCCSAAAGLSRQASGSTLGRSVVHSSSGPTALLCSNLYHLLCLQVLQAAVHMVG